MASGRWKRWALVAALSVGQFAGSWSATATAGDLLRPLRRAKTPVEELADLIDEIEADYARYGHVLAKSPDIWGEARLTKHRQEFERQMAAQIENFQFEINAGVARSDQAFLAQAIALSAALGGDSPLVNGQAFKPGAVSIQSSGITAQAPGTSGNPNETKFTYDESTTILRNKSELATGALVKSSEVTLESTIRLDQRKRYLDHLHEIRRINEGDDTASSPGYSLNLVRIPISSTPGDKTLKGYGSEVTITARAEVTEELLPRVWRQLVINDLVDQLSLPLLRVAEEQPWQAVEDPKAQESRRNLLGALYSLQNGIRSLKPPEPGKLPTWTDTDVEIVTRAREGLQDAIGECRVFAALDPGLLQRLSESATQIQSQIERQTRQTVAVADAAHAVSGNLGLSDDMATKNMIGPRISNKISIPQAFKAFNLSFEGQTDEEIKAEFKSKLESEIKNAQSIAGSVVKESNNVASLLTQITATLSQLSLTLNASNLQRIATPQLPAASSRARAARYAVPPTQLVRIYGSAEFLEIAKWLDRLREAECKNGELHLSDVQSFLSEEFQAAYDALSAPENAPLWDQIPAIHQAIRTGQSVDALRFQVTGLRSTNGPGLLMGKRATGVRRISAVTDPAGEPTTAAPTPPVEQAPAPALAPSVEHATEGYLVPEAPQDDTAVTKALMWAILVESALLNVRLNEDLVRVSKDPECDCALAGEAGYIFYGPNPPPDARQAFMSYVHCRWPIHVFAVDPVTQDQNVSDIFSLRRELQIAMALALGSGQVNMQSLTRYARRVEIDMQTVALNRTVVGFAHGPDTFGWQFLPRFQSPEVKGNAEVIFRDLLCGDLKKGTLMRDWRLEPGIRECTAIIVMPSFIDHVSFDVRGSWFELSPGCLHHSRKRGVEAEEIAKWSRKLKRIDDLVTACGTNDSIHQPEMTGRLLARVHQLKRQIPIQLLHAKVPNGNTLGGFQMFSSGVTDLAPELIGYYGEPGVDPNRETVMFLVGKNFSVHDTKVIAGGRDVYYDLISREVMRVVIPAGVATMKCVKAHGNKGPAIGPEGIPLPGPVPCSKCPGGEAEEVVDVHLATPYGVSSHLRLPVARPEGVPAFAVSWVPADYQMVYRYGDAVNGVFIVQPSNVRVRRPLELVLAAPPTPVPPTATVNMNFSLFTAEAGGGLLQGTRIGDAATSLDTITPKFFKARGAYVLEGDQFKFFHGNLLKKVNKFLEETKPSTPPQYLKVNLVAEMTDGTPVSNELTITIRLEKIQ